MAPVVSVSHARVTCTGRVRAAPAKAVSNDKAAAVVGAAAAVLLSAAPAFAGVVLEQPKLKNALVAPDTPAPEVVKKAPGNPMAKREAPKAEEAVTEAKQAVDEATPSAFNVQALWPLGTVVAGGALFALSKVDGGFEDLFQNAVKDSNSAGIGTEAALKASGGYAAPYYEEAGPPGTKAIKAKAPKAKNWRPLGGK